MAIPSYDSIDAAVAGCFGQDVSIVGYSRYASGDINSTALLTLSDGHRVLLKINSIANRDFFDAEEAGLSAIAATDTIATPHLYAKGTDKGKNCAFLMMELIETGRPGANTWVNMGRQYADMHLADASAYVKGGRFGFVRDNYIGATKQINTPKDNWIDFFRECRLEFQFKMAESAFDKEMIRSMLSLLDRLPDLLTEPQKPALLHGDMWGGNHLIDKDGNAVLIDPATYVGHPEADIAMTEMFNPMPAAFYSGYYEKIPREYGYEDRRDIYNLYHILNHYNLFGGGYLSAAARIISRYAG